MSTQDVLIRIQSYAEPQRMEICDGSSGAK